jgi:hypothetical protein
MINVEGKGIVIELETAEVEGSRLDSWNKYQARV